MAAPLEIQTERSSLVVRQLATSADDVAYHYGYNTSRPEIEAFEDPENRGKYRQLEEVEQARLHPSNPDKLRLGAWNDETFVASVNLTPNPKDPEEAEMGYWAVTQHTKHGYTTLAARAVVTYASARYPQLTATVAQGNLASARVLEKTGFHQIAQQAGKLAFAMTTAEFDRPLRSRSAGTIFYIQPTEQLMFFLRDDKPTIPCPGMIDIIGGHMEQGEQPKEAALREAREELVDNTTGQPPMLDPQRLEHFKTFVDGRPGEHNIFVYRMTEVPDFHTNEGQGLVLLTGDEARRTNFAYGYSRVVNELLHTFEQ